MSLAVKPKRIEDFYKAIVAILGAYQIFVIGIVIEFALSKGTDFQLVNMGLGLTACGFAIIVLINCEGFNLLPKCLHYVLLIPTYVNIFLIYSICNVHDCTWGNRPDTLNSDEKQRLEEFEEFRAKWVIIWVVCNSAFSYFLTLSRDSTSSNSYYYFMIISAVGMIILCLRVIGGLIYFFTEGCYKTLSIDEKVNEDPDLKRRESVAHMYRKHSKHFGSRTSLLPDNTVGGDNAAIESSGLIQGNPEFRGNNTPVNLDEAPRPSLLNHDPHDSDDLPQSDDSFHSGK